MKIKTNKWLEERIAKLETAHNQGDDIFKVHKKELYNITKVLLEFIYNQIPNYNPSNITFPDVVKLYNHINGVIREYFTDMSWFRVSVHFNEEDGDGSYIDTFFILITVDGIDTGIINADDNHNLVYSVIV